MELARSTKGWAARSSGNRQLWHHALALGVLLAVIALVIGTSSAFVTDESFVVIQLDRIEDTGRWTMPHPLPEVDPEGAAFPLHNATRYRDGYTLYGKHPLLIYLYLPIHRAFGLAGLVALSILGTIGAAVGGAALAERIRHGSGPLALWMVGAASPLFFDSFLIHAHTLAAALAALAVALALRAVEDRRLVHGLGAVGAALVTALLRTEGVFLAAALGVALGLAGLRLHRSALLLLGAAVMSAAAVAPLLDRGWAELVAGSPAHLAESFAQVPPSFVSDRLTSLAITLIQPGYQGIDTASILTLLGAVLLTVGAWAVRRGPDDPGALLLPALGAGLLAVRALLGWGAVPGLLVAFCVGTTGLVLLGGSVWRASTTRLLMVACAAYAVAVALTQYRAAGHTEWGGRYFALALPLLGAVSAASLSQTFASWPRQRARAFQACLLIAAASLGVLAVRTVAGAHERNRDRTDSVLAVAASLPPTADGLAPVVVTEDDQVPRLARGRIDEVRFLHVPAPHVRTYLDRLAAAGVRDLLLVSMDPQASLRSLPPSYDPVGPVLPYKLQWEGEGGLIRLRLRGD